MLLPADYATTHRGRYCPRCQGNNLERGDWVDMGEGYLAFTMECAQCHATWEAIYRLFTYSNLEWTDEQP